MAGVAVDSTLGAKLTLFAHSYWRLEHYVMRNVLLLRRSALVIDDIEAFILQTEAVYKLLETDKDVRGIVIDMRVAPARNDAQYETATASLRTATYRNFRRIALIFSSNAGGMQLRRLGGVDSEQTLITTNELEALDFVSRS